MSQINPLQIGALLVVLLVFLLFRLEGVKKDLAEEKALYMESEKLAVELRGLKDVYADKKRTQKSLERLLAQSSIKSAELDVKKEKKSVRISTKSIEAKVLNSLMGRILNGPYKVRELEIKKLSQTKASLEMEILW